MLVQLKAEITMVRLAVLSDIHGNQRGLEAVLDDLKQAGGADITWILGDLCAFGPRPAECLQIIRDIPKVHVIAGNTDRYLITGQLPMGRPKDEAEWQQRGAKQREIASTFAWGVDRLNFANYEYLAKLHHGLDFEASGYGWVIGYHGSPGDDEYVMLPDTPDEEVIDQFLDSEGRLGFGGHTHLPMDRDLGRWRVVNVGSVGLPKDEPRACYVLATFEGDQATLEFRRVDYDIDSVLADLKQQDFPAMNWITANMKGNFGERLTMRS